MHRTVECVEENNNVEKVSSIIMSTLRCTPIIWPRPLCILFIFSHSLNSRIPEPHGKKPVFSVALSDLQCLGLGCDSALYNKRNRVRGI